MDTPFKIEMKNDIYAIKSNSIGVVVILYSVDKEDLLDKIGIVTEKNPFFLEKSYSGSVMGTLEDDDETLLYRAQQEAKEEAGFDIQDETKWEYIGEFYTSKLFPVPIYCFCADVTNLENTLPKGDGSEAEKNIEFEMMELNKALEIPDSILQTCIMKLFLKKYKQYLV